MAIKDIFMKKCIVILFCLGYLTSNAQYTMKIINPFHDKYYDSLKRMNYPYTFPLMAKKAYKRGYDIPYAFGVSAMYIGLRQNINITKTEIGINGGQKVDLGNFIKYGPIENQSNAFTVRPDMWVLPFLDVYGIFGTGTSSTTVPLIAPVNFVTTQNFNLKSTGFGVTLAGGVGPVFVVLDQNLNFAKTDALEKPVTNYNLSMRIGHNFVDERRADRGIGFWFGTFYQYIGSATEGSIPLENILPDGGAGLGDNFIGQLNEWAGTLPPAQQAVANQIIKKIDDKLNGVDISGTKITYNLEKEIAKPWNLIVGAQYQYNKNWQLRTEIGTFGRRTTFLMMLSYRWEHFGKAKSNE